jgi:hypothetical protein
MTVVARIDSLIANLQGLKQAVSAERGTGFEVALNAALVEADAVVGHVKEGSLSPPIAMSNVAQQSDAVEVYRNTDGTASVLFPGGGIHTVSAAESVDLVQLLHNVYGSRISGVTFSGKSSVELAAQQRALRAADELATVSATLANKPKYIGGAATGFDPSHVSGYLGSMAGWAAVPDMPADLYVADAAAQGASYLSRYLAPDQISEMTQRQLLAANELMTQGGGVKEYNYLSNEDLEFILNKANDFQGAVWSPVGQAISLGAGSGEAALHGRSSS